jgi:hypothetical protein
MNPFVPVRCSGSNGWKSVESERPTRGLPRVSCTLFSGKPRALRHAAIASEIHGPPSGWAQASTRARERRMHLRGAARRTVARARACSRRKTSVRAFGLAAAGRTHAPLRIKSAKTALSRLGVGRFVGILDSGDGSDLPRARSGQRRTPRALMRKEGRWRQTETTGIPTRFRLQRRTGYPKMSLKLLVCAPAERWRSSVERA